MADTAASLPDHTVWRVWSAGLPLRFHWRDWGADSVVYDALSGQTHQFSPLAAACFACLEEGPASAEALGAALADELNIEHGTELDGQLAALVRTFRELEWIEPVWPPN